MGDLIDRPGSEVHIGVAANNAIKTIDAKRKEFAMQNAIEPARSTEPSSSLTAVVNLTPMEMLNRAVAQNAGIEVLEKLMALQERWEANQARKAFDTAISKAKAKITPIVRNATGHNQKRYADFASIARTVDPILSEFGLSYRFKTTQVEKITVTCVLSHEEGHAEETTLSGPSDTSGNKNAIQAIGSTLSYLQRYSLTAALGLASANDDDGRAAGMGEPISDEQALALRDLIIEMNADERKLLQYLRLDRLEDIQASNFQNCVNLLKQSRRPA